ncbi:hypothetical protein Tco_0212636 [Tanacetum coccineum]
MIQNEFVTLSHTQFGQILKISYNGQAVFTNEWDLSSLAFFQETEGPYYTDLPTPDEIYQFLRFERVDSNRTIKNKPVILTPNHVLTKEVREDLKRWEKLIRENLFSLGGHRGDHLPADDIQCAGFDTRPPMLDRTDFCIHGPFQMGTFRETLAEGNEGALHLGPERARVYSDLSPEDKERYNADIRATNILLQGLPKDIYTLINHCTDAEYIWYAKLYQNMRNIKMTMLRMQLNSKFINNMFLEWGRFVTTVKLNRGLKESNYDQMYAYLKQHEAHSNENKMMLERFTQHMIDPLALMSNVQQYSSQSSTTTPSTHVPPVIYQPHFADNTQLDLGLSPTDNLIENLTNTLAILLQGSDMGLVCLGLGPVSLLLHNVY